MQDKGKLTVAVSEKIIRCKETQEIYAKIHTSMVIKGYGGFGYKGTYNSKHPNKPDRIPDFEVSDQIMPNAALLFRLNGDVNPLHIDPAASTQGGFKRPIIQGLCTFGISCQLVYDKYGNNNPSTIKKMGCRFTMHVFPGETLKVQMWKEKDYVYFESNVIERKGVVLKGYIVFDQ